MNSSPTPINSPGVNSRRDTANTLDGQETVTGGPLGDATRDFDIARQVFAERFDHLAELGAGGMGRVLKAFDRRMHRTVAIKRLKTPGTVENDALLRLVREARLTGQLNHPNVMTVYDILIDEEGPYLVLEFIDGESLADRLERGPIPCAEAIALLLPICEAVSAAHGQGIIHRDIKPANIMLSTKGQPKLGDFGIARSLEGQRLTMTGAALGTLDYMAPEQMTSAKTADERADVYSLAATLYHMVTGETPRPISADELPLELRVIILKSLHRRPENRPASVVEFAQGLKSPEERTPMSVPSRTEPEAFVKVVPSPQLGDHAEITLPGNVKLKQLWCPPGTFTMGSPPTEKGRSDNEGQVNVTLTTGFWLGQTVVTQAMWTAVMETAPWVEHGDKSSYRVGPDYPAVYINHIDATAFCEELTKIERAAGRLPSGWNYALPTEAQWEYACRAGTTTAYSYGDDEGRLKLNAWFDENANDIGEKYAHPVAQKKPNPWGLYDMHGNVWEWCRDTYVDEFRGGSDPLNASAGDGRVLRGGAWYFFAWFTRSAYRSWNTSEYRDSGIGFRVSRTQ